MSLDISIFAIKYVNVFDLNITHNLNAMARQAGIYYHLWRPDEININKTSQLIKPLTKGLKKLKSNPEYFKKFNPENGWGDYDTLVNAVEKYLEACIENPGGVIKISR